MAITNVPSRAKAVFKVPSSSHIILKRSINMVVMMMGVLTSAFREREELPEGQRGY